MPGSAISQVGCHLSTAAILGGEAAGWQADVFTKPLRIGVLKAHSGHCLTLQRAI